MAAINEYDIGDVVRVSAAFTNAAGAPANTTATLRVRKPDLSVTTPSLTNDGTGLYHYDIVVDMAGNWFYRAEGTGTVAAAGERSFTAKKSAFY